MSLIRLAGLLLLPIFIFILSGFAGLIYQSLWSQYLGLFLGHSSHAQSLVLMLFMGGMAIGAWWASRRSTNWRYPLLAYAAIELLIGLLRLAARATEVETVQSRGNSDLT